MLPWCKFCSFLIITYLYYQQFWKANSKKRVVCVAPIGHSLRTKKLAQVPLPAKNKNNALTSIVSEIDGFRTFNGLLQRKIILKLSEDAMVYILRIVQFFYDLFLNELYDRMWFEVNCANWHHCIQYISLVEFFRIHCLHPHGQIYSEKARCSFMFNYWENQIAPSSKFDC